MNETSPVNHNVNKEDVIAPEINNLSCNKNDTVCSEIDNQSIIQGTFTDRCDLIAKERQRINRELREQLLGRYSYIPHVPIQTINLLCNILSHLSSQFSCQR